MYIHVLVEVKYNSNVTLMVIFVLCRRRGKVLNILPVGRTKRRTSYFPHRRPPSVRPALPQQPSSRSPHRRASPLRVVIAGVRLERRESRQPQALPRKGELPTFRSSRRVLWICLVAQDCVEACQDNHSGRLVLPLQASGKGWKTNATTSHVSPDFRCCQWRDSYACITFTVYGCSVTLLKYKVTKYQLGASSVQFNVLPSPQSSCNYW